VSDWCIRRGEARDVAQLSTFNRTMARETENLLLAEEVVTAGVQGLIQRPEYGFYLVAEDDSGLIGSLMITFEWSDWRNGLIWWLQSVYVRPEQRRRGVFRALYRAVRDEALAGDARGLRLYVERHNHAAQTTYRQLGMVDSDYLLLEELFSEGSTPAS